jgi:acetyl esterase/lipase
MLRLGRLQERFAHRYPPPEIQLVPLDSAGLRVHTVPLVTPGPRPALLWIHGGGYVGGAARHDDKLCRRFAERLGIIVAAVDYRLAPEHPFPAGLDDCYAALGWLAQRNEIDAARIAIGGACAGGGLAAALALLARDRGEISIAFQLLSYPMLDDRTVVRRDLDERHVRLWSNRSNAYGWRSYLAAAPGSAGVSSLAAPARHNDLSGLPPTWMSVGTLDLFFDEDVRFAERLRTSGVNCRLEIVERAFHGFDVVAPRARVAQQYLAAQVETLRTALCGGA